MGTFKKPASLQEITTLARFAETTTCSIPYCQILFSLCGMVCVPCTVQIKIGPRAGCDGPTYMSGLMSVNFSPDRGIRIQGKTRTVATPHSQKPPRPSSTLRDQFRQVKVAMPCPDLESNNHLSFLYISIEYHKDYSIFGLDLLLSGLQSCSERRTNFHCLVKAF